MRRRAGETVLCQICQEQKKLSEVFPLELVRGAVLKAIQEKHPDAVGEGFICLPDLNRFRMEYVQDLLEEEKGQLTSLDQELVKSLTKHEILSRNINIEFDRELTLGERLADKVAELGGSWVFILGFGATVLIWILINTLYLLLRPFDPYPYILLNLVLSCLAAVQAPIIIMSQNRQNAKDRLRSEHDYKVNLKAELEVRQLNEKIDLLLTHMWQGLLEIQKIQIDIMEEVASKNPSASTR